MKILLLLLLLPIGVASAEQFQIATNNIVYTDGQPLFVYGTGIPGEGLIIRLFAPDGTISRFDQVQTNEDGAFNHQLLLWPTSSTTFPYGTYTVEVISTTQNGLSEKIDIKFLSTTTLVDVPVERKVNTLVFVPETSSINTTLRVFVQTTSDGLLIGDDPKDLLGTTHVHLPNGEVESLSKSFQTLHEGLYFVDYVPTHLGTYVFHVVTFHQGTVSHGSAATNILSQDIEGISEQIITLNTIIHDTSDELDRLKSEVSEFGSTLDAASRNINSSVGSVSSSVTNIEEASIQLNSLLFPVVASIGIIAALQIVILARKR